MSFTTEEIVHRVQQLLQQEQLVSNPLLASMVTDTNCIEISDLCKFLGIKGLNAQSLTRALLPNFIIISEPTPSILLDYDVFPWTLLVSDVTCSQSDLDFFIRSILGDDDFHSKLLTHHNYLIKFESKDQCFTFWLASNYVPLNGRILAPKIVAQKRTKARSAPSSPVHSQPVHSFSIQRVSQNRPKLLISKPAAIASD